MRTIHSLNNGWQFLQYATLETLVTAKKESVDLPHTWSTNDNARRGTCWYTRELPRPHMKEGERVWLQCDGAAMTAEMTSLMFDHYKLFKLAEDARPWVQVDLGQPCQVNAVQINFADDMGLVDRLPQDAQLAGETGMERYIEERRFRTCWLLEASRDGEKWFVLEDKREAEADLPHDLAVSGLRGEPGLISLCCQESEVVG